MLVPSIPMKRTEAAPDGCSLRFSFHGHRSSVSERQVVATSSSRLLCGRERRRCSLHSISHGSTYWSTHRSTSRSTYRRAAHVIGTNFVEPTAIVFVGINIEADGNILALLNIELLDAIFTKEAEHTLPGVLSWHFYHIFLRHPRISRTRRYATVCRHNGNDFSC